MADGEGFVARWSRRKRAGATERQREEEAASAAEQSAGAAAAEPAGAPAVPADGPGEDGPAVADLPPIESLGRDSDFTAFMKEGVPEELKRLALRKLWTSDPVLANLDGLLEYGEDFGKPFKTPGLVATLYRVGEGMPAPIKEFAQRIVEGDDAAVDEAPKGAAREAAPMPADSPAAAAEAVAEAEDIDPQAADPGKSDATS